MHICVYIYIYITGTTTNRTYTPWGAPCMRSSPCDPCTMIRPKACSPYRCQRYLITNSSIGQTPNKWIPEMHVYKEYSRDLENLMLSLVAKDPQQRPTISQVLQDPLLQPQLAKVNIESEIYGELQQRYALSAVHMMCDAGIASPSICVCEYIYCGCIHVCI